MYSISTASAPEPDRLNIRRIFEIRLMTFRMSDISKQTIQMFGRNFRFVEQWKNTDHFPRPLGIWQLENSFGDSSCQGDRYFLITAKQCSQVNLVNVSTGELVAEY
ncbi:hypothetical protein Tsp_00473, partial [Trichinella spiralis]|uniref:hypothetical protein n=1 Tax=Trichinella spiralis TaxID=6334 RepID=UPI0001EFB889